MILGIDASNIRGGGGVVHLVELLKSANPERYGFSKVIVWGGDRTLSRIQTSHWLEKISVADLNRNLVNRLIWQMFKLGKSVRIKKCDLLFVPGGFLFAKSRPFVAMSQNLLPFEWAEIIRYGWSFHALRLVVLRTLQKWTFNRANGVIFLTFYARNVVLRQLERNLERSKVVHHGIEEVFFYDPRIRFQVRQNRQGLEIRCLYVSFVGEYKHQWNVVKALSILSNEGASIHLTLVGEILEQKAGKKLYKAIEESKSSGLKVDQREKVAYAEMSEIYKFADVFIFASSCETFGQILTEAMASALPIVCSSKSSMFEILSDAGLYFDPDNPIELAEKVKKLIENEELRKMLAFKAFHRAKDFSWSKCSSETLEFLSVIAKSDWNKLKYV